MIAAAVVAILVVGLVVLWRRASRGRGHLLAAALIAVGLVAYVTIGQVDAIHVVNGASYMGPLGSVPPSSGADEAVVSVRPGEVFPVAMTVTNTGPVPIIVRGLNAGPRKGLLPGFVGLGLLRDPDVFTPERPESLTAFSATNLGPGDELTLVALINPGRCVAPNRDADSSISFSNMLIAYDVVGWERTTEVPLTLKVTIPTVPGCSNG